MAATTRNQPCIVCGKPTARRYLVNYDNASGRVVAPDFVGRDSGLQPIGTDCARRYPADWVLQAPTRPAGERDPLR